MGPDRDHPGWADDYRDFFQADTVAKWIERQNADRNIYWMPAEATGPLRKKATKDDIAGSYLLWVDIDGVSDLSRLNGHAPPPTTIVASGGGLNLYWALSEPIHDKEEIEARNRWLAQQLGADACWNCDRILRLPGTINWPNKKKLSNGRFPIMARCAEHHGVKGPSARKRTVAACTQCHPARSSDLTVIVAAGGSSRRRPKADQPWRARYRTSRL